MYLCQMKFKWHDILLNKWWFQSGTNRENGWENGMVTANFSMGMLNCKEPAL